MSSISLQTNVASLRSQHALSGSQRSLETSLQRLSSGYRINSAADDAAGLGISENLRADVRSLHQAIRNANDGMSIVNVAEGALNEVSNILIRMRELAVQGATDSVGGTERGYLNQEFGHLRSELDRIVSVTEFNGQKLLDGTISATGLDIQIGTDTSSGSRLTISVGDVGSDALAISALGVDTKTGARAAMSALDSALTSLSTERAKLGAYSNRLSSTIANLNVSVENLTAANSRIRDVDVASETANMARSQVLVQAGVSMLAQANSAPMAAVRLLG
jgi:flagellin